MNRWLTAIALLATAVSAGTLTQTVTFSPNDLSFRTLDSFTVVSLNDAVTLMEPGAPALPMKNLNLLIPATAEIRKVEVVSSEYVVLPGTYRIYPAQPARPLNPVPGSEKSELRIKNPISSFIIHPSSFFPPDPAVYSRDTDFPGKLVEPVASGSRSGYRIAGVIVYPLQYNPKGGRLTLYTRLSLEVSYDENVYSAKMLTQSQADLFGQDVASLVVNSDKVKSFAPLTRAIYGEVDYAIITPASLTSAWQPLLALRRSQGLNAIVMPTESIYAHYAGTDNPAQVRAFIQDYFNNKGLKWVLLGGDSGLVPPRYGYLPYSTWYVPADLYYADLDWSWDSNHNGLYGEMTGDTLDLFTDVYVGRIPCENAAQIAAFINKDTIYELHPDTTYLKKAFLPWEWLEPSIGYGGFLCNDNIKQILPSDWQSSVVGNCVPGQTIDSINAGQHFLHFAGNGNYNSFGAALGVSNVAGLANTASHKLTIINSMASFCGEFDDQKCLGETLINSATGGAVAAMLNARYGWGAPPNMGPSEHFSQEFYRRYQLYREIGRAQSSVKDYFRNVAMTQMTYRWSMYDLTSFFDPAMPLWTHVPGTLAVAAPDSIPGAPQTVHVSVMDGSSPVKDAIVSWLHDDTVLTTGRTNSAGWIELFISPTSGETLNLCVSCRDYLPEERAFTILDSQFTIPALVWNSTYVADANNRLDPGDTADVFVTLGNRGTASAAGVTGVIRTPSPYVSFLDSTSAYGTIAPGDSSQGDRYRVVVAPDCPSGTQAEFWVKTSANEGNWQPFFELTIGQPPQQGACWASHDTGNFILTVTGLGSIGSTGWRAEGIGMIYPKDYPWSTSRLLLGSLVLGTDTSYVCDRFYHPDYPGNDSDFRMTDSVRRVIPPERANEEYITQFNDSPCRNSKNLEITQHSMVSAGSPLNNSCVLEYSIANNGARPTDPLATGVFCDFKMSPGNMNDSFDIAAAESSRQMAYVYTGDTACLAVKLLYPTEAMKGISVIDGYSYIQRSGQMSNATKDSFLWGKKVVMNGATTRNWAAMVSAGPFVIPAGWQQLVAFALIGGHSRADLRANADSIQQWYDNNSGISDERGSSQFAVRTPQFALNIAPNPFTSRTSISCSLPKPGSVSLKLYDAAGKLVGTLASGYHPAGSYSYSLLTTHYSLAKGIYFLRINGQVIKLIRVD